jgi:hypothetical protein
MNEDLAKRRFLILTLIRLSGVVMALFGLLIIAGKVDLPKIAGYVVFVVGLIETMLIPPLLTRSWRSPPQ